MAEWSLNACFSADPLAVVGVPANNRRWNEWINVDAATAGIRADANNGGTSPRNRASGAWMPHIPLPAHTPNTHTIHQTSSPQTHAGAGGTWPDHRFGI